MQKINLKFLISSLLGLITLSALAFFSLSFGTVRISYEQVASYFFQEKDQISPMLYVIINEVRFPRFLLAVIIGSGLAMVGALLQTVTKNDLADPFLFGLSAGASVGAVAVMSYFGTGLGQWILPIATFTGGIISAICVITLFYSQRSRGVERLILCGLSISFLFSAITSYLIYLGDQRASSNLLFWSMGGLGLARWDNLFYALLGVILLLILTMFKWRSLDAMLVDEQTSLSIGVNLNKLRIIVFVISAISTAAFVSLSGVIGFVGLVVPHLARPICGISHRFLMPLSGLIGAILMVVSDIVSRTIIPAQELPVGVVTSAIGGFFILLFLLKK